MFLFCSIDVNVSVGVQSGVDTMNERAGSEVAAAAVDRSSAAAEPRGIGGWLLFVAFGQVIGVLQAVGVLGQYYLDPENLKAFEQFPLAMTGDLAINAAMLLLTLGTAVLFFARSRHFPRVFIIELVAMPLFAIMVTLWLAFALSHQFDAPFGDLLVLERQEAVQFSLGVAAALIWIPYTLKSRRVRNTFGPSRALTEPTDAHHEQHRVVLLQAIVYIAGALGLASLLAGLGHLIGRGAFSGQLIGGIVQVALAAWLFRGSNAARFILAMLYGLGVVLSVALVLAAPAGDPMQVAVGVALAILCTAVLWILTLSKRFRAELAVNAAKYRKVEAEQG